MTDCLFCKIIAGEIPSVKVYEDDDVFAFLDIGPVNLGHTLVVPKAHATDLLEMEEEDVCSLYAGVQRVGKAVLEGTKAGGLNVNMNVKAPAGQLVFHTHVHVIPRYEDDGLKHWGKADVTQEQLEEAGRKIAAAVQ